MKIIKIKNSGKEIFETDKLIEILDDKVEKYQIKKREDGRFDLIEVDSCGNKRVIMGGVNGEFEIVEK